MIQHYTNLFCIFENIYNDTTERSMAVQFDLFVYCNIAMQLKCINHSHAVANLNYGFVVAKFLD